VKKWKILLVRFLTIYKQNGQSVKNFGEPHIENESEE
jgi:hypothetical protein